MRKILFAGLAIMAAGRAYAADPAQVMAYSDAAFQDNYTATVLTPFNKQGGANQVAFSPSYSSATMLGQLRTQKTDPQNDVVIMDTTTAALACREGLIEPLTPALVPEMADLDALAQDKNGCSPGVTFDKFVIVYDTKAVSPAPTSMMDLADPKWKGRVGLGGPPNIQGLAMTAILAQFDGGDWTKPDGAFKTLAKIAPNVQTYDPQPDPYTLILNDTLTFTTGWNARSELYSERSQGRIGVLFPKEGTALQINTISLVKGAKHRDAALAFIRYALSPAAQKAFTEKMYYAPTNTKAQIDAAAQAKLGLKVPVTPIDWNEMVKLRDNWGQRWRRDVIAAGGR